MIPKTEGDVNLIVVLIRNKVLPQLRLWEFYVLNVTITKETFSKAWLDASNQQRVNGVDEATDLNSINRKDVVELFKKSCLIKDWEILGQRF